MRDFEIITAVYKTFRSEFGREMTMGTVGRLGSDGIVKLSEALEKCLDISIPSYDSDEWDAQGPDGILEYVVKKVKEKERFPLT